MANKDEKRVCVEFAEVTAHEALATSLLEKVHGAFAVCAYDDIFS